MKIQEAMGRLTGTLMEDGQHRYRFACSKVVLFVRLVGARAPIRFAAREQVAFRIDAENLTVEDLMTRVVAEHFPGIGLKAWLPVSRNLIIAIYFRDNRLNSGQL